MPYIISIIILTLIIIWVVIDSKNKSIVREKSQRVQTLLKLNSTIKFKNLHSKYTNHISCDTKRQFDNLNMGNYLISLINSYEILYRTIVDSISFNRNTYNTYISQSKQIQTNATEEFCKSFGFTLTKFLKYEERLFKKNLIRKPQCDVTIYCKATYTSPQGRNHYWKDCSYNYDELSAIFVHTMTLKAKRETRQYQIQLERSKMTASLRYDILKRDNFRCQICGSTANDGAKLHIDHIIPVSKGGQTVPNNLRTLCDRCNLGKSDKM